MNFANVELLYNTKKVLMTGFPLRTEDNEYSEFSTGGKYDEIQKNKIKMAFSELGFEKAYIKSFPCYQYFLDNTAGGILDLYRSKLKQEGMFTEQSFDFNVL